MTGFVTAQRAAAECGVSLSRIRQLLQQGRVEGARKFGRQWLVPTPVVVLPPIRDPGLDITVDSVEFLGAPPDTEPAKRTHSGVGSE